MSKSVEEYIEEVYHIKRWGAGYFEVNNLGHLSINAFQAEGGPLIDLKEVGKGLSNPFSLAVVVITFIS